MGIPIWRDPNEEPTRRPEVKPEPTAHARSAIRRQRTIRDPRTSSSARSERLQRAIRAAEESEGIPARGSDRDGESSRRFTSSLADSFRVVGGDRANPIRLDDYEPAGLPREDVHDTNESMTTDEDFPPLRRRPARLFRATPLPSAHLPLPPPPPPLWRSTHVNGLGDRQRSWTPDQDAWESNLTTIEPVDARQGNASSTLAHVDSENVDQGGDDITSSSLMFDAQQAAMAVSSTLHAFRERNNVLRENYRQQIHILEQWVQRSSVAGERVNELEQQFRTIEEEMQILQRGATTGLSDEDLTFRLRRMALPGLRHIVSVLDSFKDEFEEQQATDEPVEYGGDQPGERGDTRALRPLGA